MIVAPCAFLSVGRRPFLAPCVAPCVFCPFHTAGSLSINTAFTEPNSYLDTSYNSNEVMAQSAERQGNVVVHTNYWATVNNPNRCILSITVDQDRKVVGFEANKGELLLSSGCQSVKFGPP
ncbi:hypothetical protein [Pseudomonas carnis]|uniref:hypothetical protein n=1 Tax=Pseudomonas carnis TaxID=2487355 RepID=UPI001F3CA4F2|nr:hypothetical protein [Pseudomonas carnis]